MELPSLKTKNYRLKTAQGGQAVIVSVVFFLFISLSLVIGVSSVAVRELKVANQTQQSKQGLFTAESGAEDFTYRIKTGRQTSASETLVAGGATTTVTLTDLAGGQKEIISSGDFETYVRKVRTLLTVTTGTSFNYGVQVGAGGLSLSNNAGIVGSVHSNGDITGASGAYITGTAIAANSAPLSAHQANDTPTTPPNDVVFGNTSAMQDFAQSFIVSTTGPLNKVQVYLRRTSTAPSDIVLRIAVNEGGVPGATITSTTLSASLVQTSYGWVEASFPSGTSFAENVTYWLVLDAPASAAKYYTIGGNAGYGGGVGKVGQLGGAWNGTSPAGLDGYFRLYVGGRTGTIDNVDIGENGAGNSWAHTVNNSTIAGNNYCETGSGNNKPCDASQEEPASEDYPIAEESIEGWKEDAASGGTIAGNYTVTANASLGPKVITGDLLVTSNNKILTVMGTIYVQGNIDVSNGSTIRCVASYGANSCIVVADGWVHVSNNGTFSGSGAPGSYLMMLSTLACAGATATAPDGKSCGHHNGAIDVHNQATGVIFYAADGMLNIHQGVNLTEATAYKINIENNATVTYESGLADLNFSGGPGGSFNVDKWREVR